MSKETIELTNLDPRIQEYQANILEKYAELNKTSKKGQIIFAGSSTTEIFPIEKMQQSLKLNHQIYNRGVRATTTEYLLKNIDTLILNLEPSKIFLQIGSNDIGFNVPEAKFLSNYQKIIEKIKNTLPDTQVYLLAYYPINTKDDFGQEKDEHAELNKHRSNDLYAYYNPKVQQLADQFDFQYINLNQGLTDQDGNLKRELTFDGLHPLPAGYQIILDNLKPYLN